jgi:hypothetical protein
MFKSFYAEPLVAAIDPAVVKDAEVFSDVVDMSLYASVEAVLLLGDMPNNTITFRVVACDSNGNNPTATLSGKTFTIGASATANDNTQHYITLTAGELFAKQPTKRYVKFGVVTGDAVTGGAVAAIVRAQSRYYVGESNLDSIGQSA